MATKLIEGFDVYPTVAGVLGVESRWVIDSVTGLALVSGRFGGQALRGTSGAISTALDAGPTQEGAIGLAVQVQSVSGLSRFLTLADESNVPQLTLAIDALGRILVYRGTTSGTFLATTPVAMTVGVWYYIEVEFRIDNPSGFARVFINGAQLINFTGVTQAIVGTNTVGRVGLFGGSAQVSIDDVYGKSIATRLGESRIETLMPNADSAVAFTPNAGGNNYSRVSEPLVDGDTTYVYSSTVGAEDLYDLTDMTSIPEQIHAVQTRVVARKDDAATRALKVALKSGASATVYGSDFFLSSSYVTKTDIYDADPATAAAWTKAGIDALKIGQKITV
ncbi:hypothetical protein DELTA_31 [Brevundimonas phage vB_BsubS-Delta]|nr:hypothetical protein DELTA_31 [Brevundimonas phage vB_BsubS-Delta]